MSDRAGCLLGLIIGLFSLAATAGIAFALVASLSV